MMLVTSKFVYERSLQRDVASVLSNLRAHVPQDHLPTVDHILCELVDMFHEVDPMFDIADFLERAKAYHDLPAQAG